MTQIELTQAELDLIQAKREEQAAEEQRMQDRIQADIVKAEANVARRLEEKVQQNAAARAFHKELGANWQEDVEVSDRTERVYYGQKEVWSKSYQEHQVRFVYGKYVVNVNKHTSYTGWGRGTDKGYKMYVHGPEIEYGYSQKPLSKAETVNKKVQDCIDTINAREEAKKKKASAVETATATLQAQYPAATVVAGKDWTRAYSSKHNYREYEKLMIAFPNGIQVAYEVYSDGRLNRLSVDFGKLENDEVLNLLSGVQISQ